MEQVTGRADEPDTEPVTAIPHLQALAWHPRLGLLLGDGPDSQPPGSRPRPGLCGRKARAHGWR